MTTEEKENAGYSDQFSIDDYVAPGLKTAVGVNGNIIIINFNELKSSERLKGASIFKTLFNINEKSLFKKTEMNRNEHGHLTILKQFNITSRQWQQFIHFIRYGKIKYYNMIDIDKCYKKRLFQEIIYLYEGVFGTFGPFPEFDEVCEIIEKTIIEKIRNITNANVDNPMTPQEDIHHKYTWKVSSIVNPLVCKRNDDWSVTIPEEDSSSIFYWRKPKTSIADGGTQTNSL